LRKRAHFVEARAEEPELDWETFKARMADAEPPESDPALVKAVDTIYDVELNPGVRVAPGAV
jgi:hypothetical protein